MEQRVLYEEFPFLKDVGKERQKQFKELVTAVVANI